MTGKSTILILTVGTGTVDQLQETVVGPFRRSFERGQWERVVLLPSQQTRKNAELLVRENPAYPIAVAALERAGDEENVDACFRQFDAIIGGLLDEGHAAWAVVADITRGTKAMSAALALAAAGRGVRTIRYVGARERDERGMAKPGTEVVSDIETAVVQSRRNRERAVSLLRGGQFAAAEEVLAAAGEGDVVIGRESSWLVMLAQFWGAWDRFDYRGAAGALQRNVARPLPAVAREFLPPANQRRMLEKLKEPLPGPGAGRVEWGRNLAADLLANARRRLRQGHTDEVIVRLYRVLELIGQYRLFRYGLDSDNVEYSREDVQGWLARMESKGEPVRVRGNRPLQLPRELCARLLKHLGDPLAARLLEKGSMGGLEPALRNRSVLIHGFGAQAGGQPMAVEAALKRMEGFFLSEDSGNAAKLRAAEFPFFH